MEVSLNHRPRAVFAEFEDDEPENGGCAHHHCHDSVDARAEIVSGYWVLQLRWKVTSPRKICWRTER